MANKTYITTQGDTWDGIAFKVYGNEKVFNYLLAENTKYLDIIVFPANIELVIPDLDLVSIMGTNEDLPSWRR